MVAVDCDQELYSEIGLSRNFAMDELPNALFQAMMLLFGKFLCMCKRHFIDLLLAIAWVQVTCSKSM